MLKKMVSIILAISLVLGMPATISLAQSMTSVVLNDTAISLKEEIYINDEGHIMCPLRDLVEQLGYLVTWNGEDQSIKLSKDLDVIKLRVGDSNVIENGKELIMNTSPVIKEDKTFVPVELFSNVLNLIVEYNNEKQILKINKSKENTEPFFAKSDDETIQNELDSYMKALVKNRNFHGSVLVAKDGKVLLDQGYGFADFKQNIMNKPQTKFAIGSVTKQFTAMAVMQLCEKGLINVEDKVSKYLSDFPNGDIITIHNLLSQTSGLKNFTEVKGFLELNTDNKDPMVCINLIKDMPLEFKPGEEFRYSNTNFTLLGIIVEKVTGESLENYLQENIFTPLHMVNTGICYGENNEFSGATSYTGFLEVAPIDDKLVLSQTFGAGSMYSTVEDLYRWDSALKTEKLVKQQTLDQIFKEHIPMYETASYGYGWMIADTAIGKEILHGGNTFGFTANIARYIDEDLTITILTNNGYCDLTALTDNLTKITFNEDYEMPEILKEIEIKDKDLYDNYVGKYNFISNANLDIIKKDNKLYAQVTGQKAFEIFPQTNNKFFAKELEVTIEFVNNDKDEVTELKFKQLGIEFVCKRVDDTAKDSTIITVDSSIYDEYVGEYELTKDIIFTISNEDDHIYAKLTRQDKYEIFPISESEYIYKVIDAKITFEKDDNNKVTKLILNQNGQEMPASKIK
ncbi:serine hydrolase [Abyssisolibacter fermentans]|uniref:serine hydrolase n=1 Tax=Abyssisolibacter fermentans TaxID=1766203 RepID=UPI0008358666|nr:serine hydrolase [Abyssisolibacter fermentans]